MGLRSGLRWGGERSYEFKNEKLLYSETPILISRNKKVIKCPITTKDLGIKISE